MARRGTVSAVISASSSEVFDLLHDYDRRLTWDTLLQAAYLDDGFTRAEKGATSVCVGRRALGGLAIKTVYVSFDRPTVAAVRMVRSTSFFAKWAASIRHVNLTADTSTVTYTYLFTARPAWFAWLLEPVMALVFRWETQKRLRALTRHFAARHTPPELDRPQ